MSSQASQILNQIVLALWQQHLKPLGFRKAARVLHRTRGHLLDVVEFQVSKLSDPNELSFTINVGVLVDGFYEFLFNSPAPKKKAADQGCLYTRAALLADAHAEQWHKLDFDSFMGSPGIQEVEGDVAKDTLQTAVPFLSQFSTPREVGEFLVGIADDRSSLISPRAASMRLAHAGILYRIGGDREKAESLLEAAVSSSEVDSNRSWMDDVLERIRR